MTIRKLLWPRLVQKIFDLIQECVEIIFGYFSLKTRVLHVSEILSTSSSNLWVL